MAGKDRFVFRGDTLEKIPRDVKPSEMGKYFKAWHFPTNGQPIGKTRRKDRESKGTQDDGMAYINISIPVANVPIKKSDAVLFKKEVNLWSTTIKENSKETRLFFLQNILS